MLASPHRFVRPRTLRIATVVLLIALATAASHCDVDDDLFLKITASHDSLQPGAQIPYSITVDIDEGSPDGDSFSLQVIPPPDTTFVPAGVQVAVAQDGESPAGSSPAWAQEVSGVWLRDGILTETLTLTLVVVVNDVLDPQTTEFLLVARALRAPEDEPLDPDSDDHLLDAASLAIRIIDIGVSTQRLAGAPPQDPAPGEVLTYRHTLNNQPDRHDGRPIETTLTNIVPAGTTFVANGSDAAWTCDDGAAAGTVCTRPLEIDPVAGGSVLFVVRVDADHPLATPIVNVATLANVATLIDETNCLAEFVSLFSGPDLVKCRFLAADINPVDNTASLETSFAGNPTFSVRTATPTSVGAAGPLSFTITVTNTGNLPLTGVTVDDPLLTTLGPAVQTGGAGDNTDAILDVGEIWTYTGTFTVTAAVFAANGVNALGLPDGDGDIDNTVTVGASGPDGPLDPQTASATVAVDQWAIPGAPAVSATRSDSSVDFATGPPNTIGCTDSPATAWTPEFDGVSTQILQVDFAPTNFHATAIEIHESDEAPFVIRIELIDDTGALHSTDPVYFSTVDTGPNPADATACPGVFRWDFPQTAFPVSSAWIYTRVEGFEQIDAVRLIGVTVP